MKLPFGSSVVLAPALNRCVCSDTVQAGSKAKASREDTAIRPVPFLPLAFILEMHTSSEARGCNPVGERFTTAPSTPICAQTRDGPTKLAAAFPRTRARVGSAGEVSGAKVSTTETGRLRPFRALPSTLPRAGCSRRDPSAPGPVGPSAAARPGSAFPLVVRPARPDPAFRPPRQRSGRGPRRPSSRPPHGPGPPGPLRPHRSPGPWGAQEAAAPDRGGGGGRHHVCRPSQKPSAGRTKRGGGGADTQADPADPRQTSGAGSPGNPAP